CARPLRRRNPLQVLIEDDVARQRVAYLVDRRRLALSQRLGPLGPRPLLFAGMNGAKEAVVLDPPCLLRRERAQLGGAVAVPTPLVAIEPVERAPKRVVLHAPDVTVVDLRRGPDPIARRPLVVGHVGDADEDRIDRHRADGGIGRLLAGRHLIDGQQLQHADTRVGEPRRDRLDVADIADAPARRRGNRKQGDEKARPAPAGHDVPTLQAKCRRILLMPSANESAGGNSEMTRNASCGKSKKYPGCVSTPSTVRRLTTRSSSCSTAGTRTTADHPPSLRSTLHVGTAATALVNAA